MYIVPKKPKKKKTIYENKEEKYNFSYIIATITLVAIVKLLLNNTDIVVLVVSKNYLYFCIRKAFSRKCPHAALMSIPFDSRIVAIMPL